MTGDIPGLLLPPTDIDLSQAFTADPRPKQPTGADMVEALKSIMTELSNEQMKATQVAMTQLQNDYNDRINALATNANASLNDLHRQIETLREQHFGLESVIDSLLKLQLLGDKMPAEVAAKHKEVVALFLRNNAVLTIAGQDGEAVTATTH
jgi:hypothetical protein